MIRKLRIKFVVINMTIVTVLLGCILGLTYCFTKTGMENESVRMMQRIAATPFRPNAQLRSDGEMRLPYFVIRLSPEGEQLATGGGYFDLQTADVEGLVRRIRKSPQRMGLIPEYHLRYCRVDTPHSQYLVFADISSEQQTLQNLLHTGLLIGTLGFFGFLAASIALSYWAIRPVEQAFQAQQQFIADASHELKTPLTVIKTNAQIMEAYPENEQMREKSLGNILTMSEQMRTLVEQLLSLARNEHAENCGETVDLSRLAEQAVLPFEPVFYEQGMELETEIQPGISVRGDAGELQRVVEILLDNASKYASCHGKTWVTLRALPRHRCALTVANEGPHIEKYRLEHFFDRFASGDPARNCRGSYGLGLPIARSIAQNHRGTLRAESRDGINSFCLELPML